MDAIERARIEDEKEWALAEGIEQGIEKGSRQDNIKTARFEQRRGRKSLT